MIGAMDDAPPSTAEIQPGPNTAAHPWPPLWTLLVKPGKFLPWAAFHMPAALFVVLVYVSSIGRAIDSSASRIMSGKFSEFLDTWPRFWGFLVLAPIISSVFAYGIWGFSYWIRLLMCGIDAPGTFKRGARVYFCAYLIVAVPTILVQVYESFVYSSPTAAFADGTYDDLLIYLVPLVFLFWSVVCSWRGVLATFKPKRRWAAHVLFLVLPLGFLTVAIGLMMTLYFANILVPKPQVASPRSHVGASFTFDYPSNWTIDADWELHEHESSVQLETGADTAIWVESFWTELDAETILSNSRDRATDGEGRIRGRTRKVEIDGYRSLAWEGTLAIGTTDYDVTQYAIEPNDDGWMVEVLTIAHPNAPHFDRAIKLVTDSLQLTHPDVQPAVTERRKAYEAAGISFKYPGNWFPGANLSASEESPDLDTGKVWVDASRESYFSVLLYDSPNGPETEIDLTMDIYAENGAIVTDNVRIDSLGPISGMGLTANLTYSEGSVVWGLRLLVTRLHDGRVCEIRELTAPGRVELDASGFAIILDSLVLPTRSKGLIPGT